MKTKKNDLTGYVFYIFSFVFLMFGFWMMLDKPPQFQGVAYVVTGAFAIIEGCNSLKIFIDHIDFPRTKRKYKY